MIWKTHFTCAYDQTIDRINSYIYLSVICIEQRIQLVTSNYILKRDDLQGEKYGLRIDLCGTP